MRTLKTILKAAAIGSDIWLNPDETELLYCNSHFINAAEYEIYNIQPYEIGRLFGRRIRVFPKNMTREEKVAFLL